MPRDYGSMRLKLVMQYDLLDFSMLYFHFWPSLIWTMASHFAMFFISLEVYDLEFTHAALNDTIVAGLFQCWNFTVVHLIYTWVGNTFVKTEVTKRGNEGILDSLSEGVVIVDQDSGIVQFRNKAAQCFNIDKDKSLAMNVNEGGDNDESPSEDTKLDRFLHEERFA